MPAPGKKPAGDAGDLPQAAKDLLAKPCNEHFGDHYQIFNLISFLTVLGDSDEVEEPEEEELAGFISRNYQTTPTLLDELIAAYAGLSRLGLSYKKTDEEVDKFGQETDQLRDVVAALAQGCRPDQIKWTAALETLQFLARKSASSAADAYDMMDDIAALRDLALDKRAGMLCPVLLPGNVVDDNGRINEKLSADVRNELFRDIPQETLALLARRAKAVNHDDDSRIFTQEIQDVIRHHVWEKATERELKEAREVIGRRADDEEQIRTIALHAIQTLRGVEKHFGRGRSGGAGGRTA